MSRLMHPVLIAFASLIVASLLAFWLIRATSPAGESAPDAAALEQREPPRPAPPTTAEPAAPEPEPKPAPAPAAEESPDRTAVWQQDQLGPLAQTFRTKQPDLAGFEKLLEELAKQAIVDPASIVMDADLVRASVTVPTYGLSGTISEQRRENRYTVMMRTPFGTEGLPLHLSHVQLQASFVYRDGKASEIQSELLFETVPPRPSDGDAGWERLTATLASSGTRIGYTLREEPDGTSVVPWEVNILNDPERGRSLRSEQSTAQEFPWNGHTSRAYAAWGALVEKAMADRRGGSGGK